MQDTDAVSCILCLQADEYGSMIKVCVPPGRIPPSSEKVICRRCAATIMADYQNLLGEVIEGESTEQPVGVRAEHPGTAPVRADRDGWDSDLPDRAIESAVETDPADAANPPRSSKGE